MDIVHINMNIFLFVCKHPDLGTVISAPGAISSSSCSGLHLGGWM